MEHPEITMDDAIRTMEKILGNLEEIDGPCLLKLVGLAVASGVMIEHMVQDHLDVKDQEKVEQLRKELYVHFCNDVGKAMKAFHNKETPPVRHGLSEEKLVQFDPKGVFH
jgi:hypothetical protein